MCVPVTVRPKAQACCAIGYVGLPTDSHDLAAQHDALAGLSVEPSSVYVDYGLTGTNRDQPGSPPALAACRAGVTPCWPWSPSSSPTWPARAPREGMKVTRAEGRLRGKQPRLSPRQETHPRQPLRPP